MEGVSVMVGCALVLLALLCFTATRRRDGLPPGPGMALPVLGHLLQLRGDPRVRLQQWRRQYGDVFSIRMGSRDVVVLCGYATLKEALAKMGAVTSGRPKMFTTEKLTKGKGVMFSSGESWKENRKTSLEILREMGMGKNVLAEKIQEEVGHFMAEIERLGGEATELHRLTSVSISNNICAIVCGQRFQYNDPVFIRYLELVEDNVKRGGGAALMNFIPWLENLPGDFFGIHRTLKNFDNIFSEFIRPLFQHHVSTFSSSDHVQSDFIYAYLREMRSKVEKGLSTTLSDDQLVMLSYDLFLAGTETTSAVIAWALLIFLNYPHVQERCYQEICDVIGTSRPTTMQDRPRLVYMEATINEVLRMSDIGPLSLQHCTPYDVSFRGYVIPSDAIIVPFLTTALHDPNVWGDPENFRPERFLDAEGKVQKPEEFIPFGLGRRNCLGEPLARMELFLYLSTLIQRFRFLPPEPEHVPPMKGIVGATHCPVPYKIRAMRRE